MIKVLYEIDYARGQKRKYLEWVRSIADTLQSPPELKQVTSYDNVYAASPQRVVEFTFESMEDAAHYFDRPEMIRIFQGELPERAGRVRVAVIRQLSDYTKRRSADAVRSGDAVGSGDAVSSVDVESEVAPTDAPEMSTNRIEPNFTLSQDDPMLERIEAATYGTRAYGSSGQRGDAERGDADSGDADSGGDESVVEVGRGPVEPEEPGADDKPDAAP